MDKNEILNLIKEVVEKTNVGEVVVTIEEPIVKGTTDNLWFSVVVKDSSLFLSRDGEGLSALNHVIKKIIETKSIKSGESKHLEILIDINGHQKKKIESIHALAHMMAERARYFKSSIEVDPMPAFERRIVHEFLSDATDLKTESEGEGSSRRVVIKYIGGI